MLENLLSNTYEEVTYLNKNKKTKQFLSLLSLSCFISSICFESVSVKHICY